MVNLLIGSFFLQSVLTVLACLGLAHTLKRQRSMIAQLEKMKRQCHRYSHVVECQMEVGQNLSCLCILLQVAEKYRNTKPDKADGAIREAKQLSATSLDSIRQLRQMSDNSTVAP